MLDQTIQVPASRRIIVPNDKNSIHNALLRLEQNFMGQVMILVSVFTSPKYCVMDPCAGTCQSERMHDPIQNIISFIAVILTLCTREIQILMY